MENRYCVIMGGGIGSRFWPFSPKQQTQAIPRFFRDRTFAPPNEL